MCIRDSAGAALLDACKEVKNSEPVQIGSYRGFAMSVTFEAWRQEYTLLLKGQMTHRASLGIDPVSYTHLDVYKRQAVGRMGFETGNILEPSCGVGNFFGMLPEEMRSLSNVKKEVSDSHILTESETLFPHFRNDLM